MISSCFSFDSRFFSLQVNNFILNLSTPPPKKNNMKWENVTFNRKLVDPHWFGECKSMWQNTVARK